MKEKLTDVQQLHLVDICVNIQQNHASAINTLDGFGKMVKTLWDQHHFGQLARGLTGLGGVLPLEIAKSCIKKMTDRAVASREGPTTFQSMFVLNQTNHLIQNGLITQQLPVSSAIHPVPVHAASLPGRCETNVAVQSVPILPLSGPTIRAGPKPAIQPSSAKKRGRPKKQPVRLVPLRELTMEGALELSHVSLKHYTRLIGSGSAPSDKTKALAIVMDYIDTRR